MVLFDVNVLIYAHREESPDHASYAEYVTRIVTGDEPFAMSELALSSFLRIVTNPRAFATPTPWPIAVGFV